MLAFRKILRKYLMERFDVVFIVHLQHIQKRQDMNYLLASKQLAMKAIKNLA